MDYLALIVKFQFCTDMSDIVSKLHYIYRDNGFYLFSVDCEEDEDISYEEACKANQNCFDNLIDFEEWKHYRMHWECDWISFVDTTPSIDETDRETERKEMILFPESEAKFAMDKIYALMNDLFNLDEVIAVEIQKER